MQILLFVITMLLLLSAITYSKMDSYRSMVLFRNRFEVYSEARRNEFEKLFYLKAYEDETMSTKEGGKSGTKAEGNQYISLAPPSGESENKNFTKQMLRDLIAHLYEKQNFYQELLKKRPQLTAEIIEALENSMKGQAKIKKTEDLANLELKDPILAEAFYKILKGFTLPQDASKDAAEIGYPPLTCFLTVQGNGKIRPYLAQKPILEVLFNDSQTVNELMKMRMQIFNDLSNDRIKPEEGKALFTDAFARRLKADIPQDQVDFDVSKSNPNRKCVRIL